MNHLLKLKPVASLMIAVLHCATLKAAVYKTVQTDQLFSPTDCEQSQSCSLKQFRLLVEEATIVSSSFGTNYSTSAFISYKTADQAVLEDFAVVQFIRGCQFNTTAQGKKSLAFSREFFGEISLFKHPTWVIDSVDVDPMYNSYMGNDRSRHALYRWNEVAGSFDPKSEKFFYVANPATAELYVKDRPGSAFFDDESAEAKNISLQFKTCIFKTTDIPRLSTPHDFTWNNALHCFDWYSSYIYNHQTHQYETLAEIDSICTE